ncbi:hypothetical protein [Streptomyces sp. NPDC012616]|uniref:hypothetical protein n=1 Tax=Streptomyces sp. NPDC012616 TaxID=3364840 RepID=UPI0036EAFB95
MTDTTGMVGHDVADLAESLVAHDDADWSGRSRFCPTGRQVVWSNAVRPAALYEAVLARNGQPTLLGGTAHGPSVRWSNSERILLLSGDHGEAVLSADRTAEVHGRRRQ